VILVQIVDEMQAVKCIPAAYLHAVSESNSGALSLQVFGSSFKRFVEPIVSDLAILAKSDTPVLSDTH
jgi:hypothetical protein